MSLFQALVLGLVQGLTEFLPVSSSGHLVIVPFIAGWPQPTVAFDVAVHVGTLLAVLWVFRDRVWTLVAELFGGGAERRTLGLLAIGTIPAAVLGGVAGSRIEGAFERPVLVSLLLGVTGWALLSAEGSLEARSEEPRGEDSIGAVDAGVVGVAQAAAILPGISRSGSTIAAGMARGLSRDAATRFSFLLAIPVIAGATIVKIPDLAREGSSGGGGALAIGVAAAALSGTFAVRGMLAFVARRGLQPFGVYCFLAMTAGLLTALARG